MNIPFLNILNIKILAKWKFYIDTGLLIIVNSIERMLSPRFLYIYRYMYIILHIELKELKSHSSPFYNHVSDHIVCFYRKNKSDEIYKKQQKDKFNLNVHESSRRL